MHEMRPRLRRRPRHRPVAAASAQLPASSSSRRSTRGACGISGRNRRGFWSFWIFLALFVVTLFAEFIANDRPIIVSYKGEWLFPIFVDYPEEKFGGFLAVTDYRDPVIAEEIAANGWTIWPPIRFSYDTHNLDLPTPAPSPPTWLLERCPVPEAAARLERNKGRDPETLGCRDIEWDWLGTDDQGRDVVARLIYGFRISVLFGLCSPSSHPSSASPPARCRAISAAGPIFSSSASSTSGPRCPQLYLLIIISSIIAPSFFVLLGILLLFSWVSLVGVVRAEFLRGSQFRICARRARARPRPTSRSCASTCCRTPWWRR